MKIDYISLDYGTKKIGVAIGDSASGLVLPKLIISVSEFDTYIQDLLQHYSTVTTLIVSHNRTFHGKHTANSVESERLAEQLRSRFSHLTVLLYDERGTTAPYGKNNDDKAAAHLLEQYFHFVVRK